MYGYESNVQKRDRNVTLQTCTFTHRVYHPYGCILHMKKVSVCFQHSCRKEQKTRNKMVSRENYCYMHNIKFENSILFDDHKKECEDMLEQFNVCTQHNLDGRMCGRSFKNPSALYTHCVSVHKVYICETCDAQSMDEEIMLRHSHGSRTIPSIHMSKYNPKERTHHGVKK